MWISQLQVGELGAEVRFELGPRERRRRFLLEGEREGPDADPLAGRKLQPLAAEHFGRPDQAAIEADVFQLQPPAAAGARTACRRETSGLASTTSHAASRPIVISGPATSTTGRRLSCSLLNQIFIKVDPSRREGLDLWAGAALRTYTRRLCMQHHPDLPEAVGLKQLPQLGSFGIELAPFDRSADRHHIFLHLR